MQQDVPKQKLKGGGGGSNLTQDIQGSKHLAALAIITIKGNTTSSCKLCDHHSTTVLTLVQIYIRNRDSLYMREACGSIALHFPDKGLGSSPTMTNK